MGRLAEFLYKRHALAETAADNDSSSTSTTLESSLFNLMENFELGEATDNPAACPMNVPSWLNMWCVLITVGILAVIVILGVLVRYVQTQRPRQTRTECFNCFPASPEYYTENFLDRHQIMVY